MLQNATNLFSTPWPGHPLCTGSMHKGVRVMAMKERTSGKVSREREWAEQRVEEKEDSRAEHQRNTGMQLDYPTRKLPFASYQQYMPALEKPA